MSTVCKYEHDFFISYPHMPYGNNLVEDFVDGLAETLRYFTMSGLSVPVYVDTERLQSGFRWSEALAAGLCRSRCMVAVCVPVYFDREYCLREWAGMEALEQKRLAANANERMILPVVLSADEDTQRIAIPPQVQAKGLQCAKFPGMLNPKSQFDTKKYRKIVQRDLISRLTTLGQLSADSGVDCGGFSIPAIQAPPPQIPAPKEEYGGSWKGKVA